MMRPILALLALLAPGVAFAQGISPNPQAGVPTATGTIQGVATFVWNGSAWVAATSGGTPTGTAGTPNAAVMSVQGVTGGTPAPVSGTVAVSNFPGTQPVSGTVTVNALPAGANAIGTVGVTALPALPTGTNAIGQVSTNPGARTLVPLDIATVTTGGTAVAALNAGHRTAGGFLQNPPGATINLCINEISTASGTTSAGSTTCILPGQSYALAPAAGAVSVITSDSAHPFAGFGMN